MLRECIYHLLDHILPSTGKSKHDTLRLEHLCAIKIMDTESDKAVTILRNLPPRMFEPVLQAVIYNCYLKYINSVEKVYSFENAQITFPESMVILILNWPYEEFILRNQISSLEPPVRIFPSRGLLASTQAICQIEDILRVFTTFFLSPRNTWTKIKCTNTPYFGLE